MKGLSVLVTVILFVGAAELANVLKQAGVSPADKEASTHTWEHLRLGSQVMVAEHLTNGLGRFARYERLRSSASEYTE